MRFRELNDGAKFRLTCLGRILVKKGDGFVTPWGAHVKCTTPLVHVIAI